MKMECKCSIVIADVAFITVLTSFHLKWASTIIKNVALIDIYSSPWPQWPSAKLEWRYYIGLNI